jgi:hypothetical protein
MRPVILFACLLACSSSAVWAAEVGPAPNAAPRPVPGLPQPPQPLVREAIPGLHPQANERRKLLNEKLQQRDRLNQEIDELRKDVMGPTQIMIEVEVLTVEHEKIRKLGFDFDVASPSGVMKVTGEQVLNGRAPLGNEGMIRFVSALKKNGLAQVRSNPRLVTLSGRPATVHVGGEIPLPVDGKPGAIEFKEFGMRLEVVPEDLGNNRARLAICHVISEVCDEHPIFINDQRVPSIRSSTFKAPVEVTYGETQVLCGSTWVERLEKESPTSKPETKHYSTLVLVTADFLGSFDENVQRASHNTAAPAVSR